MINSLRLPIVFLALVIDGSSALLRSGTCLGRKAFCQAEDTADRRGDGARSAYYAE